MKILVAISQVAKLDSSFEVTDNEINRTHTSHELNSSDKYALEEAISFTETYDENAEVVCVSIGPARTIEILNLALAMGADEAIRVWDEMLEDIELLDPRTKATLLKAVIELEEPDVVLTGVQRDDTLFGATGIYLAELLEFGWSAAVSGIEIEGPERCTVTRELEGGAKEVVDVELPAVLTVQEGINEPRYLSTRSIYQVRRDPIELNLADLDIEPTSLENKLYIKSLSRPKASTAFIDGQSEEVAADLASVLHEKGVEK